MHKAQSIAAFYHEKFGWLPDNLKNELGHFNVFRLQPFAGENAQSLPYRRRDFYKIMLVVGNSQVHYADKMIEVKKQALSFSNPQIPYTWEHLDNIREGFFCIFNQHFFHQFGDLNQYSVFQSNGTHIFELTDEQVKQTGAVYERMFQEISSNYVHKYDVLRNLVFELLHFAMKLQPPVENEKPRVNAAQRIATLFLELLERQFPLDENRQSLKLRSASDYAKQLNVHVNHLNRSIKEVTEKTTSQIIAERILQESKVLLKHSNLNVSEIAYLLGFAELTHFNNFFKKNALATPLQFRKM